eukprot:TRINITY_DN453_c2_g1_i1.p1 TRINITY_DN453_c2_g1~~TRINITY_DN453_c2_g1_i1.p1  ORF type:complete len:263 (+),score=25.73 TRINITY_DN453_c2_g1_i1:48-836(+)
MILFWYTSANIFYILGMVGYVAVNIYNSTSQEDNTIQPWYNPVYVTLAVVFVVDSILYFIAWGLDTNVDKSKWDSSVWGEILNVFGSILYLISACLLYPASEDSTLTRLQLLSMVLAALNLLACVVFAIDAFIYMAAWWNTSDKTCPSVGRDLYFWASLFNVLPSLGYVCASIYIIVGLFDALPCEWQIEEGRLKHRINSTAQAIAVVRSQISNVWKISSAIMGSMDFLFLIDAFLYFFNDLQHLFTCCKIGDSDDYKLSKH